MFTPRRLLPPLARVAARLRPVAIVALLAALAVSVLAPVDTVAQAATPKQAESTSSLQSEWDEILGQEADLVRALEDAQAKRRTLTREVADLDDQIGRTQEELTKAEFVLTGAEQKAAEQRELLRRAQHKVDVAVERLHRQIVASFVTGGQQGDAIFAILKASNGEEAGQAVAYSNALVGDTDHFVRQLERARSERRTADRRARSARKRAASRRDDVQTAKRAIERNRSDKQKVVDQVNAQVLIETDMLRAVQGKKALVESRINAENRSSDGIAMILADRQRDQVDWVPRSVEITTPLPGVAVSSGFGMRHHPILNIDRLHAGVDLGGSVGLPIHAAANGVVVLAEVRGGYGNTTVLDHGNSLATLYGHQSRIVVRPGQLVRRGEIIGYVGSTGLSTGPHCHFETRVRGVPIDPEGVIDFSFDPDYDALLRSYAEADRGN